MSNGRGGLVPVDGAFRFRIVARDGRYCLLLMTAHRFAKKLTAPMPRAFQPDSALASGSSRHGR
jgi:hypothetical protein